MPIGEQMSNNQSLSNLTDFKMNCVAMFQHLLLLSCFSFIYYGTSYSSKKEKENVVQWNFPYLVRHSLGVIAPSTLAIFRLVFLSSSITFSLSLYIEYSAPMMSVGLGLKNSTCNARVHTVLINNRTFVRSH